ncbi:MAG: ComF family protein [Verrucomicrobiota bacterium]
MEAALSFVYPPCCQLCGVERAGAAEGYVGPACRAQVKRVEAPCCDRCGMPFRGEVTTSFECSNCREMTLHFRWARAAVLAEGPVLEAIHRYKYQRAVWFEAFLAGLLVERAAPELAAGEFDCIVPVPLHPAREREREFNQAQRLAAALSRAAGIPTEAGWVRRRVATRTQTLLTRRQRAENMRGAFAFCGRRKLKGDRVLLVDDVMTTGATTSACARVLRRAGAGDVCVWTVARGI